MGPCGQLARTRALEVDPGHPGSDLLPPSTTLSGLQSGSPVLTQFPSLFHLSVWMTLDPIC